MFPGPCGYGASDWLLRVLQSMVVRCQASQQDKQAMQRRAFFAATAAVVIASVVKEEAKAEEPARGSAEGEHVRDWRK